MFWIGLIVGVVFGAVALVIGWYQFAKKLTGMTFDEMSDCGVLLIEASQNRESLIEAYNSDDDIIGRVVLEER